jgi:hypothetical protein
MRSVAWEAQIAWLLCAVVVISLLVLVSLAAVHAGRALARRRRLKRCLSGDWWKRFERDLHAYESLTWSHARYAELHDDRSAR